VTIIESKNMEIGLLNKIQSISESVVYLLQHAYLTILDKPQDESLTAKDLGIYDSPETIVQAVGRYKQRMGFNAFPDDFKAIAYRLNEDHWPDGFCMTDIWVKVLDDAEPEAYTQVQAIFCGNQIYMIFEQLEPDKKIAYRIREHVVCENRHIAGEQRLIAIQPYTPPNMFTPENISAALSQKKCTLQTVYLLQHFYSTDIYDREEDNEDYAERTVKDLGVYDSHEAATEAVERFKQRLGFKDYPEDFLIIPYCLNEDSEWLEGFCVACIWIKVMNTAEADVYSQARATFWGDQIYDIFEQLEPDKELEFHAGEAVICETRYLDGEERLVAVARTELPD